MNYSKIFWMPRELWRAGKGECNKENVYMGASEIFFVTSRDKVLDFAL
jgi:hypothetical protein